MDQFSDAMEKIDKLLKTKLDELAVTLIMLGISAAALFTGRIGEETWAVITGTVVAAWTGGNAFRMHKAAGASGVAMDTVKGLLGQFLPSQAQPKDPPAEQG
jgi:hypothetical protein